ncbi:MAG: hypothetical protein LDL11_00865 [Desulfarculus sp.]|nr:hypothetical protein [Desulfarculus sp.]
MANLTRARVILATLLLVLALTPAAAWSADQELTVKLLPQGQVERLTQVVARFSRPMRPLGAMDQAAEDAPLRLVPQPAGSYRWLDPQSLAYILDQPLVGSSQITVSVAAGVQALDGARLAKPQKAVIQTPALAALEFQPNPGEPLGPRPEIRVTLNQPVNLASLSRAVFLEVDGQRLPARVAELPREPWQISREQTLARVYRVGIDGQLPPGRPVTLVLDAGIEPVAGNRPSAKPIRTPFHSFDPLALVKWEQNRRPDGRLDPAASLLLEFNNPVKPAEVISRLKLTPSANPLSSEPDQEPSRWVYLDLGLAPRAEYDLELAPGIVDAYGTRLAEPVRLHLVTGDLAPIFSLVGGKGVLETAQALYPLRLRNLSQVRAGFQFFGPDQAVPTLVAEADRPWDQKPRRPDPGRGGVRQDLSFDLPPNQTQLKPLDLANLLGRSPRGGLTLIDLRADLPNYDGQPSEEIRRALVQVTDLGLTLKAGTASGLAWVTSLSQGRPLAGVDLELRDRANKVLWRGVSDGDGLARLPGLAELKPAGDKARPWLGPQVYLLARQNEDLAVLPSPWSNDLIYSLGEEVEYTGPETRAPLLAHAITQLPLYQPGQTVRLVVYLRAPGPDGLIPFTDQAVTVLVNDPYGRVLHQFGGKPNRYGSLAGELTLPAQARLGQYGIQVKHGGQDLAAGGFRVASFRPPDFAVNLTAPEASLGRPTNLRLEIEAGYLFGAPVSGGQAKVKVSQRDQDFRPTRLSGYAVGDRPPPDRERPAVKDLGGLETVLDPSGKGGLTLPAPQPSPGLPALVSLEAGVADQSGLTVGASRSFLAHPSAIYLGLKTPGLAESGQPAAIEIKAATSDDQAAPVVKVDLTAWREYWETVRERGPGGFYRHLGQVRREKIWQTSLDLPTAGATVHFTPPQAGTYVLVAEAQDAQGRLNRSADYLYAAGAGQAGWQRFDDHRLELVAAAREVAPGGVAQVMVKNPFRQATALVTVERLGVRRQWLREVSGPAPVIEVPIEAGDAPNVYLGVLLIRGRAAEAPAQGPDLGKPQVRIGYATIKVAAPEAGLKVELIPEREECQPGQEAAVNLRVSDVAGKPRKTQVTFLAVDERVLTAAGGSNAYDPRATFDAPRPLAVLTADGRTQVVGQRFTGQKGEEAAGGGGLGQALRQAFHPAVHWLAQGETDDQGRLQINFKLPDSLTAYRLVAVAADAGGDFGLGQGLIRARKPLQILSALPRFAVVGDRFQARVLVQNLGDAPGKVKLNAQADGGLGLEGPASLELELSPGQSRPAAFAVKALAAGPAGFTVRAEMGGQADAARFSLPVEPVAALVSAAMAGSLDARDGPRQAGAPLLLPPGSEPGRGGLTLSLAASPAANLSPPLHTLLEYPWDCLEQRLSRAAARALRLVEGPRLGLTPEPGDQEAVKAAMAQVPVFQAADGGFAFWPGGERSWPYLTAYTLLAARQMAPAGAVLPEPVRKAALDNLQQFVRHTPAPKPGQVGQRLSEAVALMVLAEEGRKVRPLVEAALTRSQGLPPFGLAALMRAAAASGLDSAIDPLVTQLEASAVVSAQHLHFAAVDPGGLKAVLGSNLRGNAMALWTLARLRPDHPRLGALAAWVGQGLGQEPYLSTQEAIFGLWALSAYLARPGDDGPSALAASLDGKQIGQASFDRPVDPPRVIHLALDQLVAGRTQTLELTANQGRPYWSARLSYAPTQPPSEPVNAGFGLARLLRHGDKPPQVGQTVDCLLTLLVPETRHQVLIHDPFPAGLEPVGASLGRPQTEDGEPPAWDPWQWRELRRDGLVLYAPRLSPGVYSFRYTLRAVAPGDYLHRPVRVEEMYAPEVWGQSPAGRLEVR